MKKNFSSHYDRFDDFSQRTLFRFIACDCRRNRFLCRALPSRCRSHAHRQSAGLIAVSFAGVSDSCLLAFLRGISRYLEQYMNHLVAFKVLRTLRDKVFAAVRRLAPAKIEVSNKGELIAMITADIELIEVFYAHTISPISIAVICVFIYLTAIFIFLPSSPYWHRIYFVMGVVLPILFPSGQRIPAADCAKKSEI